MSREHLIDYFMEVGKTRVCYPTWRLGQCLFNELFEKHVGLAQEIRGGPLDPFHLEDKDLHFFYKWVYYKLLQIV